MQLELATKANIHKPWDTINELCGSEYRHKQQPTDNTRSNALENSHQANRLGKKFCEISDDICTETPDLFVDDFLNKNPPVFPQIQMWELRRALFKVHQKSSVGPDGISVNALRKYFEYDPQHLLTIMQAGLEQFPESWKIAYVHPVAKPKKVSIDPLAYFHNLASSWNV